jgi:Zn-dependent protease
MRRGRFGLLKGIRIGRPFGIPLVVDYSWFLSMVAVVLISRELWAPVRGGGAISLSILFGIVFFSSVVAHELSHALTARALGIPTADITLFVFGGVARITSEPDESGDEVMIAMAGPLVSISLAGLCTLIGRYVPGWGGDLVQLVGLANLVLGVFNLLPGFPLDGGRVARALLWRATGRRLLATQVTAWIGRVLALAVILFGIIASLAARSPRFLLDVILGLFLWQAAGHGERVARHADQLRTSTVADYMSRAFVAVPAWASLADLAARGQVPMSRGDRVVVVGGDGRPLGYLGAERLQQLGPVRWSGMAAGAVADPIERGRTVGAAERADRFFSRYLRDPGSEYLVLDSEGRPAGMVDGNAVDRLRFVPGGRRNGRPREQSPARQHRPIV